MASSASVSQISFSTPFLISLDNYWPIFSFFLHISSPSPLLTSAECLFHERGRFDLDNCGLSEAKKIYSKTDVEVRM
jgi:hypothetical protein